ncbi:integrase catalytic domain-containing protein [Trichonephila clavipes]|nr:integrase catalytic domain-containing protein [Trichonephila clavipes]
MKFLLQDLWKEEIQWDDPLPTHIEKEWKKWCEELPHLRNLKIPRLVLDSTLLEDHVELHSFCDASRKAYGAAIYLRTKSRNGISVKLVTSKSRVAPLNCVTLPRLELLGAIVAARLASMVKKIVNLKRSCLQYHWTDSKIVLFWIKGNKTRWKQFVANRVNEITSLTDPHSWYHCAGAEFLSDYEFPKNFQQVVPELDYLTEHEKETVVQERKKLPEADRSEETVLLNSDSSSILDELLELSNNYFKVINILSYIFRFNYNCRNKSKKVGPLTVAEFKESEFKLIKHAQRSLFDKKEIPSSISNLFPFVDGEGIVRLAHTRLFHVGPQGLLNAVRQKFWPLSGRTIARKTVHQCVTCFKSRPILSSQIMGNLPSEREAPSPLQLVATQIASTAAEDDCVIPCLAHRHHPNSNSSPNQSGGSFSKSKITTSKESDTIQVMMSEEIVDSKRTRWNKRRQDGASIHLRPHTEQPRSALEGRLPGDAVSPSQFHQVKTC